MILFLTSINTIKNKPQIYFFKSHLIKKESGITPKYMSDVYRKQWEFTNGNNKREELIEL